MVLPKDLKKRIYQRKLDLILVQTLSQPVVAVLNHGGLCENEPYM
jgi:hypothetical protein